MAVGTPCPTCFPEAAKAKEYFPEAAKAACFPDAAKAACFPEAAQAVEAA
jgi:hypothetical protein